MSLKTKDGIKIYVPWHATRDENGILPTTEIQNEIRSMLNLKDMIMNNCSTVGPNGLFVSGGQFSFSASTNGKPLFNKREYGMINVWVP